MTGLLSLVCCAEFLVALLLIPCSSANVNTTTFNTSSDISSSAMTPSSTSPASQPNQDTNNNTSLLSTSIAPTVRAATIPTTATTTTSTTPTNFLDTLSKNAQSPFVQVVGGLVIGCVIFLISTLCLACKVCSLSRRLKALSSNDDLTSNPEHWEGNCKQDQNKSEPRETTVLMADISQTQDEVSNGAAKEEGGKAKEDGQAVGKKEEGDAAVSEQASATPAAAESSSSPKPQEEAANPEPSSAAAAPAATPSSEEKEKPKDGQ
ncbi:mucin-5AC [Mugil cephalus]|uniref:mucin-5AC n=1 Tax=Mugil cephalus TaxID=48193 RepID=UPI001FB5DD6F|nr:mucin-5AC [Mugil cephalus]